MFFSRLCTANKRLNLKVPIFAHICMLTRYVRLQIVIQIVNVLNLHFKARSTSRIHFKCIMHPSRQAYRHGRGEYGADTDDTNRYDFKGCQEWSWTTFCQDMSRGVSLEPDFKRNGTHCILAHCIHRCVSVCVCVCLVVCVCSSV